MKNHPKTVFENRTAETEFSVFTHDSIYAIARLCDSDVSVRPSVCHTPVLCLAERKQDREMYTF